MPKIFVATLALLLVVACGQGGSLLTYVPPPTPVIPTVENPLQTRKLPIPAGDYWSVDWFPDGRILVTRYPNDLPLQFLVWEKDAWRLLDLEEDPRCTIRTGYYAPAILPDGRLGLVKECLIKAAVDYLQADNEHYLVAYDWESDRLELLVAEQLPDIGAGSFGWNPDMTRGVQSGGSLFRTIYWLTRQHAEPMTVTVGTGNKNWSLADNYMAAILDHESNIRTGITGTPAWSPDGRFIAFFASPDAIGRSGQSRLMGEYRLYLMDVETLQPQAMLDGLYFPGGLQWSPDSRRLLFNGQMGQPRAAGVWIFTPQTQELTVVDYGYKGGGTWSPDGQSLAILRGCDEACQELAENDQPLILANEETLDVSKPKEICTPRTCPPEFDILRYVWEVVIYDVSELVANNGSINDSP
ncbi:MAG: hypothetical protein L0332_20655 [Chloroflexi bacterium]|nr:hypothetical protein [Chloroflexota bacterium]MCI0647577.1 hypothetical protein [Chloroflexota bacterium]MCI0729110.1 hypothetical protein [Chloroflexota bacterium]